MMRKHLLIFGATLLFLSGLGAARAADNPGQADLDKAFEARLSVKSLAEMENIIDLCRSALKKGLDKDNEQFAKQLLASSLYQRGEVLSGGILDAAEAHRADPRLPQVREAALRDLYEALSYEANLPQANVLVARLQLSGGGDVDKAKAAIAAALESKQTDAETRAQALVLRSGLREKPEDRIADLTEAIRLDDSHAQAFRLRAATKLALNQADDAVADFDAALKIDPEHAPTLEARGLALAAQQKWDEAKQSLTKAAELSKSPGAVLQRGRVSMLAGDHKAAIADADTVLKLAPDVPEAQLLRAQARFSSGDSDGALDDVNRVLARFPDAAQALRTRIAISMDLRKTPEAVVDLERLAKLQPDDDAVVLQWAALESSLKHSRRAVELTDGLLKKNKENWQARRIRGDARLNLGEHAEAVLDFEEALKHRPRDPGILNNLAWVLATSPKDDVRNGKRSVELAELACEVTDHKEAHILSTLAAAHAELGDFEQARKWSQQALDVADELEKEPLAKELESYKVEKPWRELLTGDVEKSDAEKPDAEKSDAGRK